ncbi:MAG: S-adenosyl-L-methionine-dependent methyltransferase [Monoraphidium minutum]|nr:MAG: S-adenosyl-L-methionine-dependent methyltransferase [Monoraphidium minutum]
MTSRLLQRPGPAPTRGCAGGGGRRAAAPSLAVPRRVVTAAPRRFITPMPPTAAASPPAAVAADRGAPAAVDADEYNQRWNEIWDGGLEPGALFDLGCATPILERLLAGGTLGPMKGKAWLVPGCGRGYDVVAAAAAGAAAVGLDLSQTAVREAEGHRDAAAPPGAAARAKFVAGDFFAHEDPSGPYDFGWDYTFLCALHPSMRKGWAAAWARHLRPGGQLLTMVYPVDSSRDANTGPPWPVTPELYKELLLSAGFELIELAPIPQNQSHAKRVGREWLGRWQRK